MKARYKKGGSFPDLNKDGKITQADILKGRGVFAMGGKFKPHKMYKDGKSVMANTMDDHLRYKKKGYTHEVPSYGKGGLWANIHAKRKRIAAGSGEKMRKPGSKGAPTEEALKRSQT